MSNGIIKDEERQREIKVKRKHLIVTIAYFIFLIIASVLGLWLLYLFALSWSSLGGIIEGIFGVTILIIVRKLIKSTIYRIPFPETWVIDLGENVLEGKGPGYHCILKFFGFEKIYKKVTTGVQYPVRLFPTLEKVEIELKEGGRVVIYDPNVWIRVKDPVKTCRILKDFETQIRKIAEQRIEGAINISDQNHIVRFRAPKLLLKKGVIKGVKEEIAVKVDEILKKSHDFNNLLKEVSIDYLGFTLGGIEFDPDMTRKRRERTLAEMDIEIGQRVSKASKEKIGFIKETIKEIAEELEKAGFPKQEAQRIASERFQDYLAGPRFQKTVIDWRGGGGLNIAEIGAQWEMGKRLQRLPSKKGEGKIENKYLSKDEVEEIIRKAQEEKFRKK